jgi:hypothetical protein
MNPITTLKTDIKADTWYSVIVDVDFTDINVASKTGGHWAVYLAEDGGEYECLAMDVPYNWHKTAATGNYAVYNMGRAFEAYVYYVDGKTSSVTYDDIMLYDDVREDILLAAGLPCLRRGRLTDGHPSRRPSISYPGLAPYTFDS